MRVLALAKQLHNSKDYQSIGNEMLNKNFGTLPIINAIASVRDIGMEAVYAYDCYQMIKSFTDLTNRFTGDSIGLHWYGALAETGKFLQETNGGLVNLPNNILGNLLK